MVLKERVTSLQRRAADALGRRYDESMRLRSQFDDYNAQIEELERGGLHDQRVSQTGEYLRAMEMNVEGKRQKLEADRIRVCREEVLSLADNVTSGVAALGTLVQVRRGTELSLFQSCVWGYCVVVVVCLFV